MSESPPDPSPSQQRQPAQRERVVLADASRTRRLVRPRQELEEQTRVGEVLVRGLVRAQLALALRLSVIVAVGLGLLPLLFAVAPDVARATVLGIRLPWLLLGAVAFPFLVIVGWVYTKMAERNERDFAELVEKS
jgi:hypothetical protein